MCFALIHYDAVDAGLQPTQCLSRRLPVRHLLDLALVELGLGQRGPPIVVDYHGGWPPANPLLRRIQRATLDRAARLLFTARDLARPFVEAGFAAEDDPRIAEVMEVSTPFRMNDRAAARAGTGMSGDPIFVWAGRLDPVKDPLTALRGFDRIRTSWTEAQLYLFYVTDQLLPELRAFVDSRPGLADHVHFRGSVPHPLMEDVFNSADLLLQASRSIGWITEYSGFVPLEAMACGVIPVVTDLPSFRSMTADGRYGVLFEAGDDLGLARGVLELDRERLSDHRDEVRAHFDRELSFRALADRLEALYEATIASSRATVRSGAS